MALAHIVGAPLQSHVMVPLIQVSTDTTTQSNYGADLDLATADVDELLALIVKVASRQYTPKLHGKGNTDFQLTRGLLGVHCVQWIVHWRSLSSESSTKTDHQ